MGEQRRWFAAALVLAALVGLGLAAKPYASTAYDRLTTASAPTPLPTITPTPNAEACRIQLEAEAQAPTRIRAGDTDAFLLGDSWASSATIRPSYPEVLAKALDLDLRVGAVGGTGYINGGGCLGRTFLSRTWQIAPNTELVVIAGGINDGYQPPDELASAARLLVTAVRARAPRAEIVIVGVPRVGRVPDDVTGTVDDVLESAGADQFVDVRDLEISLLPDRIHPDRTGHRQYGEQLAASLSR